MKILFNLVFETAPETDMYIVDTDLIKDPNIKAVIEREVKQDEWFDAKEHLPILEQYGAYDLTHVEDDAIIPFQPGMQIDSVNYWYVN